MFSGCRVNPRVWALCIMRNEHENKKRDSGNTLWDGASEVATCAVWTEPKKQERTRKYSEPYISWGTKTKQRRATRKKQWDSASAGATCAAWSAPENGKNYEKVCSQLVLCEPYTSYIMRNENKTKKRDRGKKIWDGASEDGTCGAWSASQNGKNHQNVRSQLV